MGRNEMEREEEEMERGMITYERKLSLKNNVTSNVGP